MPATAAIKRGAMPPSPDQQGALPALLAVAADLTLNLSSETRYQRLVSILRKVFECDSAALLCARDGELVPLAVEGLPTEILGQTFIAAEHPRLAEIVASSGAVLFTADDPRPDPYDGWIEPPAPDDRSDADARRGRVHSCMGCALRVGGELVGVLTLDALEAGRFDDLPPGLVEGFASLAAAAMRTASLIEALEARVEQRSEVARQLTLDALRRQGGEVLGRSRAIARLKQEIELVAPSMLTVLITGETGTGKELVARSLHALSSRAAQPLVQVNCAALPESIAESELFGHARGAFTGAVAPRMGKFELAHGATLFLDEVGELPLSVQAALLRALQFGEVQRVGSERTIQVDVRIIAATNRDLVAEVEAGRFRADLYHRLSVYPIALPPLRERGEDVLLLAGHLLDRARLHLGLGRVRLSRAARQLLLDYDWPGNVRELDHVVTRAALRASRRHPGDHILIEAEDLDTLGAPSASPDALSREVPSVTSADPPFMAEGFSLQEAVARYERQLVEHAVEECHGNWAAAARLLGLDRSNLHRLGKRLGLK